MMCFWGRAKIEKIGWPHCLDGCQTWTVFPPRLQRGSSRVRTRGRISSLLLSAFFTQKMWWRASLVRPWPVVTKEKCFTKLKKNSWSQGLGCLSITWLSRLLTSPIDTSSAQERAACPSLRCHFWRKWRGKKDGCLEKKTRHVSTKFYLTFPGIVWWPLYIFVRDQLARSSFSNREKKSRPQRRQLLHTEKEPVFLNETIEYSFTKK